MGRGLAVVPITGCLLGFILGLLIKTAHAQDCRELIQPPICARATASDASLKGICEVTPLGDGPDTVKINLTANTGPIKVGGYTVITEHYNDSYLPPVVEAMPGDTVAAHLTNLLAPLQSSAGMNHGDTNENPTNLHYFHGGIVTPNNSRPPIDASQGNGDNIYVHLKNGLHNGGKLYSFDFNVPIPKELDGRVLEAEASNSKIPYPTGLNWYHSHLHGISSDQVSGGMSGLLSVGDAKANLRAACKEDSSGKGKCSNDVQEDTNYLRDHTDVKYVLLRDIPLRSISQRPEDAKDATAEWAPQDRDFPKTETCGVWKEDGSGLDGDRKLRKGFCQRGDDKDSAWLFTLNGQRFPTITIEGGRSVLLRMGNLSANVAYWLESQNEADEKDVLKLTILSLDGVVPAKPLPPDNSKKPVAAFDLPNLLLMPASRAEIYVRNDCEHPDTKVYILRTKGVIAGLKNSPGVDRWPEVELARIVLKPSLVACTIHVALNAPVAREISRFAFNRPLPEEAHLPEGCVRDLEPAKREHRRVTFFDSGETSDGRKTDWSIATEIVHPPQGAAPFAEELFEPSDTSDERTTIGPIPFEEYVQKDGTIDWRKKHVCIFVDHDQHMGSHKQLWVLVNKTSALHNFHIHQMKFRLATSTELRDIYGIEPPTTSRTCATSCNPPGPDYKLYVDDQAASEIGLKSEWHDTIPLPPGERVFLVMSFDAKQQIGRFVFHCHILKHEDNGLMAPIEVWEPTPLVE
jgi:FtsP/CotA-like multicopper oxidase with cupredoxin domain